MTKGVRDEWNNLAKMVPIANEAGMKILPGDDYGVPIVPHVAGVYSTEFSTYVNHTGVSPLDTLRWATRNMAEPDADGGRGGHHRPEALADLIVLRDDPSETSRSSRIRRRTSVMKDGDFFSNSLAPARNRPAGPPADISCKTCLR